MNHLYLLPQQLITTLIALRQLNQALIPAQLMAMVILVVIMNLQICRATVHLNPQLPCTLLGQHLQHHLQQIPHLIHRRFQLNHPQIRHHKVQPLLILLGLLFQHYLLRDHPTILADRRLKFLQAVHQFCQQVVHLFRHRKHQASPQLPIPHQAHR